MQRYFSLIVLLSAGTVCAQEPRPKANVSVIPVVERTNIEAGHWFVGSVHPIRRSVIGSAVDGRVTKFNVNAGDFIAEKGILAELLTRQIDLQIDAAAADLDLKTAELAEADRALKNEEIEVREAKAKMAAAQAAHDYLQQRLQRSKSLFERNAMSENEMQDDLSKALAGVQLFEAARAAHELVVAMPRTEKKAQAEARTKMAQAELERLEDILVKHKIVSPFNGYVVEEHTEVGQWIKSGELVAVVEDLSSVEIEAQVLENYLPFVRLGMQARVELPSLPHEKLVGTVTEVVPRGDERSRNFPVKIKLTNRFVEETLPDDKKEPRPVIKSGMFARVSLPVERRERVLLVPQDAVVLGGQSPVVFAVTRSAPESDDAVVRPIVVELGTAFDQYFEARGELSAGMELVVEGNERLRPGQEVNIVKVSRPISQ